MAELNLFVTPVEFVEIVRKFVVQRYLAIYLGTGDQYRESHDATEFYGLLLQPRGGVQFYLAPPPISKRESIANETIPRLAGWIKVHPGSVHETDDGRVLTMSSLVAEDRHGFPIQPARWLRRLKQDLGEVRGGPTLRFGVVGANVKFGGEADYARVGYSEAANSLLTSGTRWKQFADGNVEFSPLRNTQSLLAEDNF